MDNGKSVFEKLIKDDRAAHEQKLWRGTFLDYLERVREDPSLSKLAHSRVYDIIMKIGTSDILEGDADWKIKISADESKGTLTISDNGIGEWITQRARTTWHKCAPTYPQ